MYPCDFKNRRGNTKKIQMLLIWYVVVWNPIHQISNFFQGHTQIHNEGGRTNLCNVYLTSVNNNERFLPHHLYNTVVVSGLRKGLVIHLFCYPPSQYPILSQWQVFSGLCVNWSNTKTKKKTIIIHFLKSEFVNRCKSDTVMYKINWPIVLFDDSQRINN